MPYTPPSTVTGSDLLTAALWNTQVKDNLNELRNPPFCKVILTSTISSYAGTDISWSSAPYNVGSMWSSGQTTRITAQQTGLYLVTFNLNFTTGTGANACFLNATRVNPTTGSTTAFSVLAPRVISGTSPGLVVNGVGVMTSTTQVVRLAQNEYLTFWLNVTGINGSGSLGPSSVNGSAVESTQTNATVLFLGAIA